MGRMAQNEEKIDVHNIKERYAIALRRFEANDAICPENKTYILRFLRECSLGKTVLQKQKKRIHEKRLLKYLYALPRANNWLGNKDFKLVTQDDMEDFISRLEENRLEIMVAGTMVGTRYSDWTKRDFKVVLKKFYKWLIGEGKDYPKLVSWIDTHIEKKEPPSISIDEIKKCVEYASSAKGKAMIWALFETGARAEEFLNIRLKHIKDKGNSIVAWIDFPKTFKRNLPIYEGAEYLREWLNQHPQRQDGNAQLFPIGYDALRQFLNRVGEKALQKRINPHLLRHSFATWLASKKVGRYQMCKLMGWAMSSDMPDQYIDRTGVVEEEAIQSIRGDELNQAERENHELKMSMAKLESQYNEMQEFVAKRQKTDEFLNVLLKDEKLGSILVNRIKEAGLQKKLLSIG